MKKNNFKVYKKFINEKMDKVFLDNIKKLENSIIKFSENDKKNVEIPKLGPLLRSILQDLLKLIFELKSKIKTKKEMENFLQESLHNQILYVEKLTLNKDIDNLLHSIKKLGNSLSHYDYSDEVSIDQNFSKTKLVESLHSISLILNWLTNPKDKTKRINFNSTIYF